MAFEAELASGAVTLAFLGFLLGLRRFGSLSEPWFWLQGGTFGFIAALSGIGWASPEVPGRFLLTVAAAVAGGTALVGAAGLLVGFRRVQT